MKNSNAETRLKKRNEKIKRSALADLNTLRKLSEEKGVSLSDAIEKAGSVEQAILNLLDTGDPGKRG